MESLRDIRFRGSVVLMDKGMRPDQEDYVLDGAEKGIYVVADGFGGPGPGAVAAKTACEEVKNFLRREAGDDEATMPYVFRSYYSLAGNVLFNSLIHANRKVMALNRGKSVHERGGASVIAGFLDGDLLALANVGACTGWLFRDGVSSELVVPRTYGRLYDPFLERLKPRDDMAVPLSALGIATDLEPEIFEYRVRPGDWLLLHTDGLTAEMRNELLLIQHKKLNIDELGEYSKILLSGKNQQDNLSILLVLL